MWQGLRSFSIDWTIFISNPETTGNCKSEIFSMWEEKWQLNGELSMLSCMASLRDMHDLGSHRLHIYIYIYILSIHCLRFYALCWDITVHKLMWRLRGFHLLLLSDKFHLNFCFPDPPKKLLKKKKTELCTIMSACIWMNSFFSSIMDSTLTRASDRSRKKKSSFAGFLGTNSRKNWLISREFCGRF